MLRSILPCIPPSSGSKSAESLVIRRLDRQTLCRNMKLPSRCIQRASLTSCASSLTRWVMRWVTSRSIGMSFIPMTASSAAACGIGSIRHFGRIPAASMRKQEKRSAFLLMEATSTSRRITDRSATTESLILCAMFHLSLLRHLTSTATFLSAPAKAANSG